MKTKISTLCGIIILLVIMGGVYWYVNSYDKAGEISEQEIVEEVDQSDASKKKIPIINRYENAQKQNEIQDANQQDQGAGYVSEENRIQVILPSAGEKLEIGEKYEIQWGYSGDQKLTIALQTITPDEEIISSKIIASDVLNIGAYVWTVTSVDTVNTYRIEVYPTGARELTGRSSDFSITGEELI